MSPTVIWHDVECGAYDADLPLWRELAAGAGGPVLDVGAGTGRVALDLAGRGHEVIALDRDPELLAALRARTGVLPVTALTADARDFALPEPVPLAIVPMQTLQLLPGAAGRAAFLRCAHAALQPGGVLAAALADALEGAGDPALTEPPLPDLREVEGTVYASQPVAVRREPGAVAIERIRQTVAPDGSREAAADVVRLHDATATSIAAEARPLGFTALAPRRVAATEHYVGSQVVVLCRS